MVSILSNNKTLINQIISVFETLFQVSNLLTKTLKKLNTHEITFFASNLNSETHFLLF